MALKPWRSLGESNPSFQIEKLTNSVVFISLSGKPCPKGDMNFCGCPGEVQTNFHPPGHATGGV